MTIRLMALVAMSGVAAGSEKQFPLDIGIPLPLPSQDRQLRGHLAGMDMPFARVAFGAIPMGAIPLGLPEDVEVGQAHPVVEGSLRDLLDFGSAMGAAVLRPGDMEPMPLRPGGMQALSARRGFGGIGADSDGALELPLEALHVKMQERVPKPLNVEDGDRKVRIYGVLPKNLTAKTLKVSLSGNDGRNLGVQYFLGQGAGTRNAVGVDEHFELDFTPVDMPAVTYKASTGAFELLLSRPAVSPRKQVAIAFEPSPSMPEPSSSMPELSSSMEDLVAQFPADVTKPEAATVKVTLNRKPTAMHKRQNGGRASPREFVHESKLKRLLASSAQAPKAKQGVEVDTLKKVTKALHQAEAVRQNSPAGEKNDKAAARVKEISDKVKHFVSDAHLFDAQKELKSAFAPLDLGLVMLEVNHRIRAH